MLNLLLNKYSINTKISLPLRLLPLQLAFYDPDQEIAILEDGVEHKKFGHELDANARIQLECDVSLEFVRLYNILVNDL